MGSRPLPAIDAENEYYWTAGANGRLLIARCGDCQFWIHPPSPVCRRCHGTNLAPQAVSGRGVVFTYTVNHQRWRPDLEVPFVGASVELIEQAHLRVSTEIIGCPPHAVFTGMPVEVTFLQIEDVWLPLFTPTNDTSEAHSS